VTSRNCITCLLSLLRLSTLALTAAGSLQLLIAQDFSVSATTPPALSAGGTAKSTITIKAQNGFNSPVTLSVGDTCPAGASCTFTSSTLTPTASGTTSVLSISTTTSTATQSTVDITGTAGAMSHTSSVTVTLSAGSATNSLSASDNLKNNFGFGLALGLSANVSGPDIVNNATVDANGIVRVNTRANTSAGFLLETHYFIWPNPPSDTQLQANSNQDLRWWGTGPFVAAQPGSSQIISAVGAGWMIGFRRPKGSKPSGFGLGVGYEAIPAAQVLGSEFVNGQPAPKGPNGQPLPIRYETEDKGAMLIVLSITF
jgi:hypothetical protein